MHPLIAYLPCSAPEKIFPKVFQPIREFQQFFGVFGFFEEVVVVFLISDGEYFPVVGRERGLKGTSSLGTLLELESILGFLLFLGRLWRLVVSVELKVFAFSVCLLLELVEVVEFELGPCEVGLFGVFLHCPPESSLEEALHKQVVVALPKVELQPILGLEAT